jgi:hypothetical protein
LHCGYAGASVQYWTQGIAPNRKFVVYYQVFKFGASTTPVNFQVVLLETTGQIEITAINVQSANSKSIGVNNATGTIGAAAPNCSTGAANYWTGQTALISTPQAWRFIPPVAYTFNWTNAAVTSVANAGTDMLQGAGTGLGTPTAVTTTSTSQTPSGNVNYQVYIKDPITTCSEVYSVAVTVTPTPAAPTASNSVQCGTQVPLASVSCPTCDPGVTYNWYTAASGGSLFQGKISENFNAGTTTGTTYGNASVTGSRCVLTPAAASQSGALLLGSTGVNSNAYHIEFDFLANNSDALGYNGADGFSYSFGDDVNASATTPNAENGSGTKLKIGFVTYTNGTSTAGIYLMYNCTTDEQTSTTPGVLAYSSNMAWKNTTSPVHFSIDITAAGLLTLSLDGTPLFSNVDLSTTNYLLENKATWLQLFKARTGAGYSQHAVDNVIVEAQPAQAFTSIQQAVSASATYYVQTVDGICGSGSLTPISITVNTAPAFAITSNFSGCPGVAYPISVTTGSLDYVNFTWSPAAVLYSDAAGTVPYVAGTSATTVYVKTNTLGVMPTITCTAVDGGVGAAQCGSHSSHRSCYFSQCICFMYQRYSNHERCCSQHLCCKCCNRQYG